MIINSKDIEEFQDKLERSYRIPYDGKVNDFDAAYNKTLMQAVKACLKLKVYLRDKESHEEGQRALRKRD